MPKYAKLNEDGTLEYAPINLNGVSNWINDENAVLAAGYLPLEELESPEGQYVSGHKIFENKIVPVLAFILLRHMLNNECQNIPRLATNWI